MSARTILAGSKAHKRRGLPKFGKHFVTLGQRQFLVAAGQGTQRGHFEEWAFQASQLLCCAVGALAGWERFDDTRQLQPWQRRPWTHI